MNFPDGCNTPKMKSLTPISVDDNSREGNADLLETVTHAKEIWVSARCFSTDVIWEVILEVSAK